MYVFRSKMWKVPLRILLVGITCFIFILIPRGRRLMCEARFDVSYKQDHLPTFQTIHDLKANNSWYIYLTRMYSDLQLRNMRPVAISKFWILYPTLLPACLLNSLHVTLMPRFPRDIYHGMLVLDLRSCKCDV